jgi:aspartate/methionine/tyrosine aminotransferase
VTKDEADAIARVLVEAADNGCNLVVVSDDAYFGLFYNEDVLQESMFALLAGIHERILAVKVDGPTKEQFVWGFRTGMLTFATRASTSEEKLYGALEKKTAGAIRSAISNCSQPAQSVLAKVLTSDAMAAEHQEKRNILEARARKAMEILAAPEFGNVWEPYPFNSGYFMCLKLKHVGAEAYRKHLLEKHGIGVIADGESDIRVAFSAVEIDELPELYMTMAKAAEELQASA